MKMMQNKPKAILCDVNGTLFTFEALAERMTKVGLPISDLPVRLQSLLTFIVQS
jgi:hypothetical protein